MLELTMKEMEIEFERGEVFSQERGSNTCRDKANSREANQISVQEQCQ